MHVRARASGRVSPSLLYVTRESFSAYQCLWFSRLVHSATLPMICSARHNQSRVSCWSGKKNAWLNIFNSLPGDHREIYCCRLRFYPVLAVFEGLGGRVHTPVHRYDGCNRDKDRCDPIPELLVQQSVIFTAVVTRQSKSRAVSVADEYLVNCCVDGCSSAVLAYVEAAESQVTGDDSSDCW